MPDHNAAENMLGYLYQVKYALVLLLDTNLPNAQISIEKFDDIAFSEDGFSMPLEMIQLKHHMSVRNKGSLTDTSADLWRTLKAWIDNINNDSTLLDNTFFSIITTAKAPKSSIAADLKNRAKNENMPNVDSIYDRLKHICNTSISSSNDGYYQAFLNTKESVIKKLLGRIVVIDSAPNILDCDNEIRKQVRYSSLPKYEDKVIERIEGFWYQSVIRALCSKESEPKYMTQNQIRAKIVSISQEYADDNLPTDINFDEIDSLVEKSTADMIFCEQLRLIGHNSRRVRVALRDYYCAFSQRSNWLRDGLVYINDLDDYERKLKNEWERCFADMEAELGDQAEEDDKKREGRKLLRTVEDKDFWIQNKSSESFITRGSYHMLANRLEVGWHIDFFERLKHLLSEE